LTLLLPVVMAPRAWLLRNMRICDNPAHDACEQIIAHFAAITKIYLLKILGVVGHFKDSIGRNIPDTLHPPVLHILTALSGQGRESFVGDVKAVANVNSPGSIAHERTYMIH
jgi:hypothetical protein